MRALVRAPALPRLSLMRGLGRIASTHSLQHRRIQASFQAPCAFPVSLPLHEVLGRVAGQLEDLPFEDRIYKV